MSTNTVPRSYLIKLRHKRTRDEQTVEVMAYDLIEAAMQAGISLPEGGKDWDMVGAAPKPLNLADSVNEFLKGMSVRLKETEK